MTTGQLLFYGGVALLGLTVILAIIFIIKKPKYAPESTAYAEADPGRTHSLRNGYPTDRMTVRREPSQPGAADPIRQSEETALLTDTLSETLTEKLTEPLSGTERLQETDVLEPQQTTKLTEEP